MSKKNQDNHLESRPLPVPPDIPRDNGDLYSNRYSYFKNEIQKWKTNLKPSNNSYMFLDDCLLPTQDTNTNTNINKRSILNEISFDSNKKTNRNRNINNSIKKEPIPHINNIIPMPNTDRHYFTEKENIKSSSHNINKPIVTHNSNKQLKQIDIPKNLNIKEEQLPFFQDLQNVLTLFSELKSRIEKVSEEKGHIEEKNRLLTEENNMLKEEIKAKENNEYILNQK